MAKTPKRPGGTPPKAHQFKPGQSGNPGGRPKRRRTMRDAIEEAMERPVEATIDGRRQRLPLKDVLAHQFIAGLSNDPDRFVRAMRWLEGECPPASADDGPASAEDEDDAAIVQAALPRAIRRARQDDGGADD